jgi:hypothetical protein
VTADLAQDFPEYHDQLAGIAAVYPQLAEYLSSRGWQPVWALYYGTDAKGKPDWRPLSGTTGGKAPFPAAVEMPAGRPVRLAFRPPENVKVLDVDHYGGKLGWHTIERAEEALGLMPATWKVSSRGPEDKSGRYLFRVREGLNFRDRDFWKFRDPDTGATSLEVVRTDHRFSWAPGDINPRNGQLVECFDPDGNCARLPGVTELPFLPDEWQDFLADAPKPAIPQLKPVDTELAQWWLAVPDSVIGTRDQLARFSFELQLAGLSPEDTLAQLKRVSVALELNSPWLESDLSGLIDANTQEKVARKRAEWAEVSHALWGDRHEARQLAAEMARKAYDQAQLLVNAPDRAALVEQITASPAAYVSDEGIITDADSFRRVVVGEHEFDPPSGDDQSLAEAALDRINGARYCADSGSWLVWGPVKWAELGNDPLEWIISQLSGLMPYGDPKPDEEDPEGALKKRQYAHRKYLRSAGASAAVARKAKSLLAVPGAHPLSILRADADANPRVLWAGGKCWDITASVNELTEDVASAGQPHLMSAECAPRDMEIPGFRALVNVILPDPVAREFWLDMMARGLLGYQSKRTIPLAVGETKRGKTLLLERLPFGTYLAPLSGQDLLGSGDREEARRLNVLVGRRLPYVDEGISSGKYAMSRLKKITSGGQRLPARGIFGKEYEFRPSHTLVMLVNPEEEPSYTDDAVKERLCRVEFNGDPEAIKRVAAFYDPDTELWEREAPGVLAFFIRRAARIMAEKSDKGTAFAKPESVKVSQDQVAGAQDPVLDWIMQCTEPSRDRGSYTDVGILYENYLAYIKNRPVTRPTGQGFGVALTKHKVDVHRSNGRNLRALKVKQAWANAR